MLKFEVSISANSMICTLNKNVGIDVSYSKMFFKYYILKVYFIYNVLYYNIVIVNSYICSNSYIFRLLKIIYKSKFTITITNTIISLSFDEK